MLWCLILNCKQCPLQTQLGFKRNLRQYGSREIWTHISLSRNRSAQDHNRLIHLAQHLCMYSVWEISWRSAHHFSAFVVFMPTLLSYLFVIEWGFGQAGVACLSALLKALLRWWWKDLSNGITHHDKCPEPGGSALLPPAFWRMALIHSAVALLRFRVLGTCIDCLFISLAVFPAANQRPLLFF